MKSEIQKDQLKHEGFIVVRNGLPEGGAERRALTEMLFRLNAKEALVWNAGK